MPPEINAPKMPIHAIEALAVPQHPAETAEVSVVSRRCILATAGAVGVTLVAGCSERSSKSPLHGPQASVGTESSAPAASAGSSPEINSGLAASSNPDLRILGKYETTLGNLPEAMRFLSVPTNEQDAQSLAAETTTFVHACKEAGISPRFILEPNDIDLTTLIASCGQGGAFRQYLQYLKAKNIPVENLGTFVPLPEPNLPDAWSSTDAGLFKENFTAMAGAIKEELAGIAGQPGARVCMMLDAASGPWGDRTYAADALLEYASVRPGLVDEFGMQGFPRVSGSMDPHQLINSRNIAKLVARTGAQSVWINTGTYAQENDPDSGKVVAAAPEERKDFLTTVAQEIAAVRAQGTEVKVTIFAQNKMPDEADWSYPPQEQQSILRPFADQVRATGASFTIFDAQG